MVRLDSSVVFYDIRTALWSVVSSRLLYSASNAHFVPGYDTGVISGALVTIGSDLGPAALSNGQKVRIQNFRLSPPSRVPPSFALVICVHIPFSFFFGFFSILLD